MLDKDKDGFLNQKEAEQFDCREVMNIFSWDVFKPWATRNEDRYCRYHMGLALKREFMRGCGV